MTNDNDDIDDYDDDVTNGDDDRGSMRAGWCCEWLRVVDVQLYCVEVKALNLILSSVSL